MDADCPEAKALIYGRLDRQHGAPWYPNGYSTYSAPQSIGGPQTVNPYTGKPISRDDPLAHISN
ncbi:MAG: hypothetical protein EOR46_02535 [Mesorhizobium sp.]|nr:MAG: hypothetical protein EOR46_02535 [Mesorhizobium sp.]RWK70810.1 MAG: hypothetical protein EOR54_04050 [Mesorhizobium sp.]RWK81386.1 MAG: hypothetical protein EOR50_02535 [Mesorhizobium sp.]RWK85140.1 MAG: hypothetical protein EOR51_00725 [Mesorhizobium sp.]RWL07451.1 MAG: hypothetical protein EOR55_06610 [Mesorhizobium sp.]